ncbi:hypothetical protein VQ042_23555 [Aurantimonas sp. A2-1-M11]|uniref:hypothetical protein n=1 Tax=Aurantimonas sp. A2-1-M11 TaxID=3113712 RepID=UPI002F9449CA
MNTKLTTITIVMAALLAASGCTRTQQTIGGAAVGGVGGAVLGNAVAGTGGAVIGGVGGAVAGGAIGRNL